MAGRAGDVVSLSYEKPINTLHSKYSSLRVCEYSGVSGWG
jgi:hypothetical protein